MAAPSAKLRGKPAKRLLGRFEVWACAANGSRGRMCALCWSRLVITGILGLMKRAEPSGSSESCRVPRATLLAVGLSVAGSVAAGCMCLDFFKPLLIGQCFGHVADDGWDGLMAQGVGARHSSKCGHVKIKS